MQYQTLKTKTTRLAHKSYDKHQVSIFYYNDNYGLTLAWQFFAHFCSQTTRNYHPKIWFDLSLIKKMNLYITSFVSSILPGSFCSFFAPNFGAKSYFYLKKSYFPPKTFSTFLLIFSVSYAFRWQFFDTIADKGFDDINTII